MKTLNAVILTLIMSGILFTSCHEISQSIQDTLHPNDTVLQKKTSGDADKQEAEQYSISAIINTHTSTQTIQHTAGESIHFLTDTSRLKEAETALRALPQYAGKEIFIYLSAYFHDDGNIYIMLRHPDNPAYVDNYLYTNGAWSALQPVQLSVHDKVANQLVSLNSIRFVNVAKVARLYNEKAAQIEGASPLSFAYISIWNKEMRWFPNTINGSRSRYAIAFNADGTLKSFKQH
jgi:hypothetical protein